MNSRSWPGIGERELIRYVSTEHTPPEHTVTGDQILRKIAQILKENIREIDIAARYGGEEFCVLLPDTDLEGAQYAAERIRQATEKTVIEVYDNKVQATVSVGLATFSKNGETLEELLERADQALYKAKEEGRNRVWAQ